MPKTLLDQLKDMTVVVADTGDIASIERFRPQDATTNPSLILAAAQDPAYAEIIDEALSWAKAQVGGSGTRDAVVREAADRCAIEFGRRILDLIPGRVSTEVDARLSHEVDATVGRARKLIGQYEAAGVDRGRILVKIAATWEGIRAGEQLERDGIHCNLTLMFGLHQAIACGDANITLISPFVGRILDWYKADTGRESYPAPEDPGVLSVRTIYTYLKHFGYGTEVMGASFRNAGEITELAGCDLLTIAPKFLDALGKEAGDLPRKLSPDAARAATVERIDMDQATFERMHTDNRMASEKLAEGIDKFADALVELESLLAARLGD